MARNVMVDMMTTASFDFSSDACYGVSSGNNSSDCFCTTSVSIGNITTGMIVTFFQVTGGTIAAGVTSGIEYMVSSLTTTASSGYFQIYGKYGSSAVEVTADSTGPAGDYWCKVINGPVTNVSGSKHVDILVQPTTGWNGEFKFCGSAQQDVNTTSLGTTGNVFLDIAYYDLQASGTAAGPIVSTSYIDSTGGTSSGTRLFRVPTEGIENVWIRTRNAIAGGLTAKGTIYYE